MSVSGYFSKSVETRMPKGKDSLGIRSSGPVMTGEKSVEQACKDDAIRAADIQPSSPRRQYYTSADDYDPVLRFHCRLQEPSPRKVPGQGTRWNESANPTGPGANSDLKPPV